MKPLSKEASAALSALKATDPTSADEARVRKNLERTLGIAIPAAGLAVATTATTAQAATTGWLASLGVGAKVFMFVAAVGVGSFITVGIKSSHSSRGGEGRGEEAKPLQLAKAEPPAPPPPPSPEIEIEQTPVVEKPSRSAGPLTIQSALEIVTPKNVKITSLVEKGGLTTLAGTAASFDDVSELMRALNPLVCSPKGPGRVVGRNRSEGLLRVEPVDGEPAVLEWPARDLGFIFTNIQLKSTDRAKDGNGVVFNLTLGVDLSLCNGAPPPVRQAPAQVALVPTPAPEPSAPEPSAAPEE